MSSSTAKDEREELENLLRIKRLLPVGSEQHRRADEQISYWRQRAGWFDDDETMLEYNNGVYDTYYQLDDDGYGSGGRGGGRRRNSDIVKQGLKVLCVLVALGLSALMFRAIMRRMGTTKKEKKRSSDSRSRSSRSKSKSRSRSRSRSRKSRATGDYNLMDDEDGKSARSKRSTRSKSGSRSKRRSRSRSRPRSRSKSRSDAVPKEEAPPAEPVLV